MGGELLDGRVNLFKIRDKLSRVIESELAMGRIH